MPDFLSSLFDSSFMPHGHCYRWLPEILWLHAISDATIAFAYYSIPFFLIYIVRKRKDLAFPWIFVMFGAFILLCGTTHILQIWSIWNGTYRLTGVVKAITGAVSVATAFALVPLVPRVIALVGPEQLRAANDALRRENEAREEAERELRALNRGLEARVAERTAELEHANAELRELNQTLEARVEERTALVRALASELTLAEQRERQALAEVLHDDLQQHLYGVQLKLRMARTRAEAGGGAAAQIAEAEALVADAIGTTRRLTVDLSPLVLEGGGLDEALRWLVPYMESRFGLRVDLSVEGALTVPREDMRVLLFQAVREALFNVAKHAETDRARVSLAEHDDRFTITVEDEGRGFDAGEVLARPAGVFGGFGLRTARERLGLFGASLDVTSSPGGGTRVRISIPVASIGGRGQGGGRPGGGFPPASA